MITPEQIALHRHWCRADAIKYVLFEVRPVKKKVKKELHDVAMLHSQLLRLEAFYALFYVVIEGYKELGFKYEKIDILLEQEAYVAASIPKCRAPLSKRPVESQIAQFSRRQRQRNLDKNSLPSV